MSQVIGTSQKIRPRWLLTLWLGATFVAYLASPFLELDAQSREPPFALPAREQLSRLRTAQIVTTKGTMYFDLFPEAAPWHVANFKYLADKGFYRNLSFHALYPQYLIQGGRPGAKPESGPGYSLPPEFSEHQHKFGSLGMSRRPDWLNPQRLSHGSQFHIILGESKHLDRKYTIFGQLRQGDEVLRSLVRGDRILEVKVYVRANGR